jgi:hypothetical protein
MIMAVNAQVLPVAAIRRVVLMVMVLVMDGKQVKILDGEFPATAGTNPGMDSQ